jgi:hypothetical protein
VLNIEFVGLACFRVWEDGGPVTVLDPYTPDDIGMPNGSIEGDTILASSFTDTAHFDPTFVAGHTEQINALDVAAGAEHRIGDSPIVAVPVTEDPERIDAPRDCAMYGFKLGGLDIVHMGDAGYVPSEQELAPFKDRCDVLLLLAGILFTPPLEELDRMIDILAPKWILPMHYFLEPMIYAFRPAEDFVAHRSETPVVYPRTTTVQLPLADSWGDGPTIVVPEAAGLRVGK